MKLFCRVIIISLLSVNLDLAQTNWLRKPANLILDGVPNISASLATDLAVYRSSFADSLVGWDPIELQPIIMRVHGYAEELWKVPRAGEPPKLLLKLPNFTESVYCNSRTGDFVFRIDDSLGGERYQLYRYVAGAGDPLRLTDGESANFYPRFSNAGDWVMYSSPKRNGKHMDLYAVKPIDPKSDHLVAQLDAEDWAPFDFSPDDRMVVISDYKSESESYLWTLDIATGEKRLLTSPGKKTPIFNGPSALFSKDGKGIYHITDRDSGFYRLAYINIATRRYTYLTGSIPWDVEEFVLSPDRTLLAYTVNEAGFSQLHIIDTSKNKELSIPKIPRGVISSLCWHNDGNHLGFKCSSGSVPGDIYAVEISSRKLEHWTSPLCQ